MFYQRVRQSLFAVVTMASIALIVQPYLYGATVGGSPAFTSAQIGQQGSCVEQTKLTAPDSQCEFTQASVPACPSSAAITKTFKLAASATAPFQIIEVSGGVNVTYTINVKTGCLHNNDHSRQACLPQTGIQFTTFDGPKAYGELKYCPNFKDQCLCAPFNVNTTIVLPLNVFQQIKVNCGCNVTNNSFTYPEVECKASTAECVDRVCPGTNGGKTYYLIAKTICP